MADLPKACVSAFSRAAGGFSLFNLAAGLRRVFMYAV